MFNDIQTALIITVLGMGLVFAAILVLWLAITLLVTVSTKLAKKNLVDTEGTALLDMQRRAAVAAVVVALARQSDVGLHEFPLPPTAFVSAWQAVMRSNIIKKRGQIR